MDILTKIVKLRIDVRLLGRGSFYLVQFLHESLRVLPNGRIVLFLFWYIGRGMHAKYYIWMLCYDVSFELVNSYMGCCYV